MSDSSISGDVLFEVKRENLETGLRGYPVGHCVTSYVDPNQGLFYAGHPVSELVFSTPEELIYLLHFGHKGTDSEIAVFQNELYERGRVSSDVISHIRSLPRKGDPMHLFAATLLIAGAIEGKGDYAEDALDVVAKAPTLAALVINHHAGWGGNLVPEPERGYIENFVHLLHIPGEEPHKGLNRVFKLFNILHYDHGGGNLSAFTGKAIASGLQEMYASLAGAICALGGPRHGRANRDCLAQLEAIVAKLGPNASLDTIESEVRNLLTEGLLFGFGHAVLRVEDPRATFLYGIAEQEYSDHPLVKMALKLRSVGVEVLKGYGKVADPYPNVDAISGAVLAAAGFHYPTYFSVLFGMARCVGIARQIVYERCEAREGKGIPIYRPKFFFKSLSA